MKIAYRLLSLIVIAASVGCAAQPTSTAIPQVPATATAGAVATLAPATTATGTPTLAPPSAYHLVAQTADQADETITRMEQIILTVKNPYANDSGFYSPYHRAVWYAAWDALALFPRDPRAEKWRWKMAHSMALSGDLAEADQAYSDLITSLLNSGHVSIDDLPKHVLLGNTQFSIYMPSFVMEIGTISVPHVEHGFIAKIGNLDQPDSPIAACFLITKNADKGGSETRPYSTFFIQDSFIDFGYSIMSRDSIDCSARDMTDDGIDEIVTNRYSGGHNGYFTFRVFDIRSLPPKAMPFTTKQGEQTDTIYSYSFGQDFPKAHGKTQIHLIDSIGQANCGNYEDKYFQWTGKSFDLSNQVVHFGLPPDTAVSAYCVDQAMDGLYQLDAKDSAALLEKAIDAYRPYAGQLEGIFDELILRLGVDYALLGETQKARSTIAEVVRNPSVKDSVWIEPAKEFLELYQQPADLYRGVSKLINCTPYRDDPTTPEPCVQNAKIPLFDTNNLLDYILKNVYPSIPLDQVTASLKKSGVVIAAEGSFDFVGDHQKELWFTSPRPQGDEFYLWVVAGTPNGNAIFKAGYYEPNIPQPTLRVAHSIAHPFYIKLTEGEQNFELVRDPKTGEPRMNWWLTSDEPNDHDQGTYASLDKFRQLRQELLSNNNSSPIYGQMLEIDRQDTSCPFKYDDTQSMSSVYTDYYDCGAFYYTLAFAAELAGNEPEAVKRYYAVWSVYPDSPFAVLAREKLEE